MATTCSEAEPSADPLPHPPRGPGRSAPHLPRPAAGRQSPRDRSAGPNAGPGGPQGRGPRTKSAAGRSRRCPPSPALSLAAPHAAASLPTPSNPWVTPQRHMPHDPLHTVLIPRPGLRIHTQGNGGGGGGEAGNVYHHHPPRPASEQRPTTGQPPPMPPRAATPGSDPLPRATLARLRSSPREAAVPSPPRRLSRSQLDREPARGPSPASRPLSPPSRPIGCPNYGGGASARRLAHGCVYPGHGGHNPASRRRLPTGC
ncbi:translation initiation factor IF-2-like [Ochotona curzoniae]|uniref:translation initiation factor IF-2-like n=1 Tax=Ochotona curzoniae TaxID=130825 RepID=UPI001B347F36|nr:translation initiation factor IF-2-like [Ochotona curzoniae]